MPKDNQNDPYHTLKVSEELYNVGVRIIIGPIFKKNLAELNQINDDSYIMVANYMGVADFAMVSGGIITGVVNTINTSQSLLTLSFAGSTAAQTLFNSCNGI